MLYKVIRLSINHSWRSKIKRFVLTLSREMGVSFVSRSLVRVQVLVSSFYFSFHFIPRVLEGTSQELTWNPTLCHPGQQCRPLIGQGQAMLASDWLTRSPALPPGPRSYVNGVSTIFWDSPLSASNGVQNYLTNVNWHKIPRFSNFPWNRRVIFSTIKTLKKFKILCRK